MITINYNKLQYMITINGTIPCKSLQFIHRLSTGSPLPYTLAQPRRILGRGNVPKKGVWEIEEDMNSIYFSAITIPY